MAGFDDGEDRLHEAAALGTLSAERQFPPDHRGRKARSLMLLVGSTPSTSRNVHNQLR